MIYCLIMGKKNMKPNFARAIILQGIHKFSLDFVGYVRLPNLVRIS